MNTNFWTEDEDRRLMAARQLNMPWEQIVKQYLPGRTASAASGRHHNLMRGTVSTTYSPDDPGLPSNEPVHRAMCERGSRDLLKAYHRYYEKHVQGRAA